MKLLFTLFFSAIILNLHSQRHTMDFGFRLGTSVVKHKTLDENNKVIIDKKLVNNSNDKGIYLNYNFKIWKKADLHLSTGFDFSETKHTISLFGIHKPILLNEITLKKKRIGFYVGLFKKFQFKQHQKFSIKAGAYLYYKNYFSNGIDYINSKKYTADMSISYTSKLTTYHELYHNIGNKDLPYRFAGYLVNSSLNYKFTPHLSIHIGVDLLTSVDFYYDFDYIVNYYSVNSTIPYLVEIHKSKNKNLVVDDYIHFSLGLTYLF